MALPTGFVTGERVYLREVRPADVGEAYYRWMSDPEVNGMLESRFFPSSMESLREFVQARLGDRSSVFLAIVLREDDRHVGNIKLGPIDWIHRTADIGLLVGERDCWGKGVATEAISLITDYAFRTLNLRKVTASCYGTNPGSARAFEKAGFAAEGLRREQFHSDGRYVDQILLGRIRTADGE